MPGPCSDSQYLQRLWLQWFPWVLLQSFFNQVAFNQLKFFRFAVRILRHLCITSNTCGRAQVRCGWGFWGPWGIGIEASLALLA